MNKRIVVISGFSGAGKGTLVKRLFELEQIATSVNSKLWLSVSDTTRPPRDDGGDNYNYISSDEYRKRIFNGIYLEHNEYGGHGYGTPHPPVSSALEHGDTVVLEIDYNGMTQVQEYFRDSTVSVITVFIFTDAKELLTRLRKRGDSPKEIKKRLSAACLEAGHVDEYDYVLNNDNFEDTARNLWMIVTGMQNPMRKSFNPSQFCNEIHSILNGCDILSSVEAE